MTLKAEQDASPHRAPYMVSPMPRQEELSQTSTQTGQKPHAEDPNTSLMLKVLERSNVFAALKRVETNKGAPGVDGMKVEELCNFLKSNWERIREDLLSGSYKPSAVRRVEIPKASGDGVRLLGIPTVLDRLIQQSIQQVLTPLFDPKFSDSSFGFRPSRGAHGAIKQAHKYIKEGNKYVVDIDLENFFNTVNHDRLMTTLRLSIIDQRLLELVRKYLNAGVMSNGLCTQNERGVPQGGPLSPLLSNIVLDELDKELEARGHKFVRYADDLNTYVRSRRAGERVLASLKVFIEKRLKLRVNENKSAVDQVSKRKFLGFSFIRKKDNRESRIRIAPQSMERVKKKIREMTSRTRSMRMQERTRRVSEYMRGWLAYFHIAETPSTITDLEKWIRRRLRQCLLRQWKLSKTKLRKLKGLGLSGDRAAKIAFSSKGSWRLSLTPQLHQVMPVSYWRSYGLMDLQSHYNKLRAVL
jgi:group II intron reverse transcriptase/maturase